MTTKTFNVGNLPPEVLWTVVRGDSAVFRVYVADENRQPLALESWTIDMEIKRQNNLVLRLFPQVEPEQETGYFTVRLTPFESELLATNDIFDIQLFDGSDVVWTIAQGKMRIIEDVTSPPEGLVGDS